MGGFPFANYSTDSGRASAPQRILLRRCDGSQNPSPYFLIYASTRGVQTHRLQYDWLEVGGSRLRLTTRGEFWGLER